MASKEILQTTELKHRLIGLTLEVDELRQTNRETKKLLFEKSQETLRLYARNGDLRDEVDGLKEKLGDKDEEVTQLKEESNQLDVNATTRIHDSLTFLGAT